MGLAVPLFCNACKNFESVPGQEGALSFSGQAWRYSLGLRMLQLGIAARHSFNFIDIAEPFLVSINEATGENANLAVEFDAEHFTYVRQLMSRHPIRHASWAGRLLPMKDSANASAAIRPRWRAATRSP